MYGQKVLAKLDQKKYRQEHGIFMVEGKKGVLDALNFAAEVVQLVATDRFVHEQRQFCQLPEVQTFFHQKRVLTLADHAFNALVETTTPQGIAAVVQLPRLSLSALLSGKTIAILDDIRDPGNLGTIIRTADWFGVDALLCVGGADPYQPKVVRSSMGSLFHLPIFISEDLTTEVDELKGVGFTLVVTRPELADQPSLPLPRDQKVALVFGNESRGTSPLLDETADQAFSLPRFGKAESLNVAVSFGLVLYELKNPR